MLKRENVKEIIQGVKIKNPNLEESIKLMKKINSISKNEIDEIDYDNPEIVYILFKKLIISDLPELKKVSKEDFIEAYRNPSHDMEVICFEIGKVLSNSIQTVLRNNIAQLMETELKLTQIEAVTRINAMTEKAKEISKI